VHDLFGGEYPGATSPCVVVVLDSVAVEHFDLHSVRMEWHNRNQLVGSVRLKAKESVASEAEVALPHLKHLDCGLVTVRLPAEKIVQAQIPRPLLTAVRYLAVEDQGQRADGSGDKVDRRPHGRRTQRRLRRDLAAVAEAIERLVPEVVGWPWAYALL
jgi:hypothetical protein